MSAGVSHAVKWCAFGMHKARDIALGMPRYNSDALELIKGKQSQDIEQQLGYEYGAVAIHRDDMIVL